ncbi:conjugal transfer protein TrbH [Rhizobium leucaenae]|uniref:conjugal transfer protein TrbH n=1 Tax=Rhizobiaceae TaxID=82115 RepID=UPI0007EE554A|nr:conjugal transfer protein TrbH [Rhizobium leucaenae]
MRIVPICFLAALLAGCQTGDDALTTSATPAAVTGQAASAIAGDMASRFAEQIGSPETTMIHLDNDETEYATALEAALKGWGYTVTSENKTAKNQKTVDLAYSIDAFEGQILSRLTAPSIAIARAYTKTAAGATPASPLSVMRRN